MITLITGTPGSGKTAWTVQELTRLPSQRKIYVHGIPDLKIAHEPIFCLSELCDHCRTVTRLFTSPYRVDANGDEYPEFEALESIDRPGEPCLLVEDWPGWATHGSLIVIDEVQRIWRPAATKLPDEVAALETHRHKGLDFWLISQGPHLFHSNIRLLIGKHIHLVAKWSGRNEYEFPECRQNVASRSDAVVRPYKLPKKIFHLYTSSSLHVAQSHRKPLAFYGLIVAVLFLSVAIYFSYQRVTKRISNDAVAGDTATHGAQAPGGVGAPATASNDQTIIKPQIPKINSYPDFMPPKLNGPIESAPAYANLIPVKSAPILIGCVQTPDWCRCYSRQAAIYPTSEQFCRSYRLGSKFNPFK